MPKRIEPGIEPISHSLPNAWSPPNQHRPQLAGSHESSQEIIEAQATEEKRTESTETKLLSVFPVRFSSGAPRSIKQASKLISGLIPFKRCRRIPQSLFGTRIYPMNLSIRARWISRKALECLALEGYRSGSLSDCLTGRVKRNFPP